MRLFLRFSYCLFLINLGPLFGQGPTLVGAGYNDNILRVAPGQITTLFVAGLETVLADDEVLRASTVPLPTSLGAISATVRQERQLMIAVPLFSISQRKLCGTFPGESDSPACRLTAITVQIPYELVLSPQGSPAELTITENGNTSEAFRLLPMSSNLHIQDWCDAYPVGISQPPYCGGIVTHADGTPVTADSPALAGETVVVYAVGLGKTIPQVSSGGTTPAPAPTLQDTIVFHDFAFVPNAAPSYPSSAENRPDFVGLVPGGVGLYQINVKLPNALPPVPACSLFDGIGSNLTINVASSVDLGISFSGARICVQPPQ